MKATTAVIALWTLALATCGIAVAASLTLVTDEEARLPPLVGGLTMRGVTRGPGIRVVSPDPASSTVKSPVELKVRFEPRGGSTIDVSSVKVIYLKSPAVDLTGRLASAIKPDGIDLSQAHLPVGEHHIRVSVADAAGRTSSAVVSLRVAE